MILETDISAVLTFAGRNLIDSASSSSRIEITEFGIISNSQNEGAVADPNTTSVTELARYPWVATLSIDGENVLVRCEIPRDEGPWNIGGVSLYVGSTLIGLFYWPSRWVKPAGVPGSQRFFELVLSRGGISGKLVIVDTSLPYVRDISDLPPISAVNQNKIYVVSNRSASLAPNDQWVIAYPQNGSWNTSVVTLTVPPRPSSQSIGPFYSDTPAPTTTAEQSHLLQYSSKYGLPIGQMGELVADGNFGFLFSDGSGKIKWVHPKDYLARSNRDGFMPAEIFAGGLNADRLGGFYPSRDPDPNTIPVRDADGNITGGLLGNAETATRLKTPVTIAGQPFDGTQNVIVTADNVHSGTFPGSYSFAARPSFAGNVPWDSGNFNPNLKLDKFSAEDLTFDLSDGSQKNINFWYGAGNGGSSLYARGDTGRVGMSDDANSRVIWEYNPTGTGSYFFGGASMSLNGNQVWHQGNFNPNLKANLDSPAFTGIPTAPTASLGVITDQIATTKFVYDVVEDQLVGLLSFRGGFTPAAVSGTGGYPTGGGSGPLGEIRVGDAFVADSDGWVLDKEIHTGDWVIARVDGAGQDEDDWTTLNSNLTYVPEDQANKVTVFSSPTDVQYPSAKLVKDNLDLKLDKFSTESLVFDTQLSSKSITFSFGTGNGGISITSDAVDRNLEFWDHRESRLILEYNPAAGGSLISDVPNLSLNGNLVWHQGNFNPNDKASLDGTSVLIPSGSTADRPAPPLGTSIRFNTDTNEFEGWNGSEWGSISGSLDSGTIAKNYFIIKQHLPVPPSAGGNLNLVFQDKDGNETALIYSTPSTRFLGIRSTDLDGNHDVLEIFNGDIRFNGDTIYHAGNLDPSTKADLNGSSIAVPAGDTAARPATPSAGNLRFNTDINTFEVWDGSTWGPIGTAGQTDWTDIQNKPATFPPSPHTHPVAEISDATVIGKNLVTAANAAAARTAIGAVNKAGDTMTGPLSVSGTLFVNAADASGSPIIRLMDETGVRRGTVYWDRTLDQVWMVLYDATGAVANSIRLTATDAFVGSSLIWTNGNKQIADGQVLGNVSGSTGVPVGVTISALLDKISSTRGAVLYRGASGWAALGAGAVGQVLTSGGAGADPSWQNAAAVAVDPWECLPIGVPIPVFDHIPGVSAPPTDKAYRYVKLTAGLTGAGGYNAGCLASESVSGSAPYINATAVIGLAGSPLGGQTIRLLNTEGRFLRAGTTSGTLQDDTLKSHTHTATGRPAQDGQSGSSFASATTGAISSLTTNATGDTETRPRNIWATYYMRIK